MKKNDLSKLQHITKQLKLAKKTAIKVGIPADVGNYPKSNQTVAEVGQKHEYGLGVPRRSFLRMPFDVEKNKLNKAIKSGYKSVLNGGDVIVNLNKIGIIAQNISRTAFKTQGYGQWKDISKKTKEAKGSSKILIDTARLLNSVHFWVVKD